MIGIIDYGMGNLGSVSNALEHLGVSSFISSDPEQLKSATGLILPGVGAAGEAMKNLHSRGLEVFIKEYALELKKPFLGICLGMQLLLDFSEEGNVDCLSLVPGVVKKFSGEQMRGLKVPQIGWNEVKSTRDNQQDYFYFVHSYYCDMKNPEYISGTTEYGVEFTSMIKYKNLWACQFHPEKSSDAGLEILEEFYLMTKKNK